MIPPEVYTGLAVFLASIAGGICVAEYTLHRGKNMIALAMKEAFKQIPILQTFMNPKIDETIQVKKKPEDYD